MSRAINVYSCKSRCAAYSKAKRAARAKRIVECTSALGEQNSTPKLELGVELLIVLGAKYLPLEFLFYECRELVAPLVRPSTVGIITTYCRPLARFRLSTAARYTAHFHR
jgi:hypothetical protein